MVLLTDFNGTVEKINEEKRKLEVMVKIFGRKTPLELKLYASRESLIVTRYNRFFLKLPRWKKSKLNFK